jgi:hypothetical protein
MRLNLVSSRSRALRRVSDFSPARTWVRSASCPSRLVKVTNLCCAIKLRAQRRGAFVFCSEPGAFSYYAAKHSMRAINQAARGDCSRLALSCDGPRRSRRLPSASTINPVTVRRFYTVAHQTWPNVRQTGASCVPMRQFFQWSGADLRYASIRD